MFVIKLLRSEWYYLYTKPHNLKKSFVKLLFGATKDWITLSKLLFYVISRTTQLAKL